MEIIRTIGAFEVRKVGQEGDQPYEVYTSNGGFVSAHYTRSEAVSMANTLDAEDRQRFS